DRKALTSTSWEYEAQTAYQADVEPGMRPSGGSGSLESSSAPSRTASGSAAGSSPTFTTQTNPGSRRNASTPPDAIEPSVSIQVIVPSPSSGRSRRSSSAAR